MKNWLSEYPYLRKALTAFRWILIAVAVFIVYDKFNSHTIQLPNWKAWQWAALIVLSAIGLCIESAIWFIPARNISALRFRSAFANTLIFQYFHLFAPSGISEFSARLGQFQEKKDKKKSIEITLLIQISKWLARLFLTAIAAIIWTDSGLNLQIRLIFAFAILLAIFLIASLIRKPHYWHSRFNAKWNDRLLRWLPATLSGKFPIYKSTFLSLAKVMTYTMAFAILLLPPENGSFTLFIQFLMATWIFYFALSFLPSLGLAEGLVKVGAGILFFSESMVPEFQVGATTLLVWTFNKAIPGMIGGIYSLKVKLKG
jgi:hypothetical protein